jgi:flagellar motor protein MotB
MRNLRRSSREEEEEESVFVPMTDMTVSFLFILMILLAFFAVRFSDKDTVPRSEHEKLRDEFNQVNLERDNLITERDKLLAEIEELQRKLNEQNPLEIYIARAQMERFEILRRFKEELKIEFKDQILVEISPENDALRFKGEGLFASGARSLLPNKTAIVERLAELITEAVSCYTVNDRTVNYGECNPYGIIIEAVQIEGHTDDMGTDPFNIELSTARANDAFFTMLHSQDDLLSYRNIRGQPVISVAGYGEMRPIAPNDTTAGKAENRRIDLRLIMYTPRDREQVDHIQQRVRDGLRLAVEEAASSGR